MYDFEYYDDFEDYNDIIVEVMSEEELYPRHIPNRTRIQGVRGYGYNTCENCNRTWNTYRGHVVIDLKEQEVVKIWKQKCMRCDRENEPTFHDLVFRELVFKAIDQERRFRNPNFAGRNIDDDGNYGGRRGSPHKSSLCEKCEYGRTKCWIRK